ncbi:MAG: SagB/ThcOx family dehydrogenase [Clostridia bacterium]|nr:SagB/ThcOx family dehydrogenase [Clostridia bacterium]
MDSMSDRRSTMKSRFPEARRNPSDQRLGAPQPPLVKPFDPGSQTVDLPSPRDAVPENVNLYDLIERRESRRQYSSDPISLAEVSFLLWATQGIKAIVKDGFAALRTVPSGGSRHAFETYLAVNRVEGLKPGIYRYLPIGHRLLFIGCPQELPSRIAQACFGQDFVATASVVFFWSVLPYRCEWRYSVAAHKTMIQDSGHLCQNLYIACEALSLGTCAIGAYDQWSADELLGLDGEEEFVIYAAPVGRPGR